MLRRLLVSILGFLALWLGTALPAIGAADLPTHPQLVHAYAYDGDCATAPYGPAIERRPPTIVYDGCHAVGSSSCGVSACPAGSTSPSAYGFDHPYKVARVTDDTGMIRGSVEDTHEDSVDVDHGVAAKSGVAANAGPGAWGAAAESMSSRAAGYQAQNTGGAAGSVCRVGGVKFDGFANGVLQEGKVPGYARFVKKGVFRSWFRGQDAWVSQAERQIGAAGGMPITWSVAEDDVATAINNLFMNRGNSGITVVHVPAG